ncbi:MAG: hypothetical protein RR240_11775 [Burkholderiaceae bacterium]
MMRIIYGVVAAGVLAIGLWLGYKWGSGNLEQVRGELASVRAAGQVAQKDLDTTKQALATQLAGVANEYEQKAVAMRAAYEQQKSKLEANVASASSLAAKAQGQLRATELERQKVAAQLASATGAAREQLQREQSQLDAQAAALKQRAEGLECLERTVPVDEVVRVLNQVTF